MTEKNVKQEVIKAESFQTKLSFYSEKYLPLVKNQISEGGSNFDDYSRQCVVAAIGNIYTMLHNSGNDINEITGTNMNQILYNVALFKLNANVNPRECYFNLRKKKIGDVWEKQVEMGIEGDGNDAILRRFGVDVNTIYPFWLVHEGDLFKYPKYYGTEVTPPEWEQSGESEKVVKVVYPIKRNDGAITYHIEERRGVIKNLAAHVSNNLMNETFGICEDRYKATEAQKKKILEKKSEIMSLFKNNLTVDEFIDLPELSQYISPSWTEPQSRESMIVRKMRNNIVKKIPKDFDAILSDVYHDLTDDTYREVKQDLIENANSMDFEEDCEVVGETVIVEEKNGQAKIETNNKAPY